MRCSAPLFNRATSNPAHAPGWHDRASGLHSGLARIATRPTEFFRIPPDRVIDRVIELGAEVEI
jgi:K+ transporter